MKAILICSVLALAACSEMKDYYPGAKVVTIEGQEHLVRKLGGGPNTYQAMENKPTMGQLAAGINAQIYSRNVKAIEAATSCKVDLASIQNSGNSTIAAVNC